MLLGKLFWVFCIRRRVPLKRKARHAIETAQKLSEQLGAAENRIAELEAENQLYRERSERAEEWLRRIYSEIQGRFIREP